MFITVTRKWYTPDCTIGTMTVDTLPNFTCFTLEQKTRTQHVPNLTAIPAGTYNVEVTFSPHFGKNMPLIDSVPGYSAIRIHDGNTEADTEGCILVGQNRAILPSGQDEINNCEVVFEPLLAEIQKQRNAENEVFISIIDTYAPISALSNLDYYKP